MSTVLNFNFTSSLLILFIIQPLSGNSVTIYKLPRVVTFTLTQTFDQNFVSFTGSVTVIFVILVMQFRTNINSVKLH